jgi:thioredoxin 1
MTQSQVSVGLGIALIALICLGPVSAGAEGRIDLEAVKAKNMPALLEFGRGWCIPCKYMKPILNDMAKAYNGRAIVTTVDMDANKGLVRAFRIRMMPTQVFLTPDGKEFYRNEGTFEREQIIQVFSKMGLAPPGQMTAPSAGGPRRHPASGQARQAPQKPW